MAFPKVFVSSTCYDLSQVRANLKSFIEERGYIPVLSEYDTFPVNPSAKTVQNCTKAVEDEADIFILIVGGRYGSQDNTGLSITNIEYLKAHIKGIPIYAFVSKDILSLLPAWKANPEGDFSFKVDDTKLFDFVERVRNEDSVWVFPFEVAQDIIQTLQNQLAHLFYDCLKLRQKMAIDENPVYSKLAGNSLRIALEKPLGWEYKLFSELLSTGMRSLGDLQRDLKYQICVQKTMSFSSFGELLKWMGSQYPFLRRHVSNFGVLINTSFKEAVGEPGCPGDVEKIYYVVERLLTVYRTSLEWTLQVRLMDVPDEYKTATTHLSSFCESIIQQIEKLGVELPKWLNEALEWNAKKEGPYVRNIDLAITLPNADEFLNELKRLRDAYEP